MTMNARTHNIGLAIWRLKCYYKTFVQGSTTVILLNFCANNPPHRQAENRYLQVLRKSTLNYNFIIFSAILKTSEPIFEGNFSASILKFLACIIALPMCGIYSSAFNFVLL